jgi:hypothetical protein
MRLWLRKRKCPEQSVHYQKEIAETKAALERAKADRNDAHTDLAEARERAARSRAERQKNHFAPSILAALESSRGEK